MGNKGTKRTINCLTERQLSKSNISASGQWQIEGEFQKLQQLLKTDGFSQYS